jgi:hypothetical protein
MNGDTKCETCSNQENSASDLPIIQADDMRLQDMTKAALWSVRESRNRVGLYQCGGRLCRLKEKEPGKLVIENVNDAILRGILSRCADYKKMESGKLVPPPGPVIKDILALGVCHWRFKIAQ